MTPTLIPRLHRTLPGTGVDQAAVGAWFADDSDAEPEGVTRGRGPAAPVC
jgi:hypothetical protein